MNKSGITSNSNTQMNAGTTGASKDRMKNDGMTQGGASKDGMGQMNKGGTSE